MTRIAFHVHSDWSYDGRWPLERISHDFRRRGFDAVLLCEHCRTFDEERWQSYQEACRAAGSHGAILVPGIEYSDPENVVHVPVWGVDEFLGSEIPTAEMLEKASGHPGAFIVLAHPNRRNAWELIDKDWLDRFHAIEIWNRKADGIQVSRVREWIEKTKVRRIAALDFHSDRQRFPMATTVNVDDGSDSIQIIKAMREGRFNTTVMGMPLQMATSRAISMICGLADGSRKALLSLRGSR